MPLAAAVLGGAVISAGAGLLGSKSAAKSSQQATDQTIQAQQQQSAQTRADLMPYTQTGYAAQNALAQRLGLSGGQSATGTVADTGLVQAGGNALAPQAQGDPGAFGNVTNPSYSQTSYQGAEPFSYDLNDYQESPGLQWQLSQARRGIEGSAAARGSLGSGSTLAALADRAQQIGLQDFNQSRDTARSYYDTDENRNRSNYDADTNRTRSVYESDRGYLTNAYNTQTGNLQNLAATGQNAAAGAASAGQTATNNISNALSSNASNQGNAALTAAGLVSNTVGQGINALSYQQGLSTLRGGIPAGATQSSVLGPRYSLFGQA